MLNESTSPLKSLRAAQSIHIIQSLAYTAAAYGVISLSAPQIGYPFSVFAIHKTMKEWTKPSKNFETNQILSQYASNESLNYEIFANPRIESETTVFIE